MMTGTARRITGFGAAVIAVLALFSGCGAGFTGHQPRFDAVPPTNEECARALLAKALAGVEIPASDNRVLTVSCTGDSAVTGIVYDAAVTAFLGAGYRIADRPGTYPRITIRVDSLAVTITETYSRRMRRTFERTATVALFVEYEETAGMSRVFITGESTRDRIPPEMIDAVQAGQPYAALIRRGHPLTGYIKPFGLAVIMTILVWSLYSYRG